MHLKMIEEKSCARFAEVSSGEVYLYAPSKDQFKEAHRSLMDLMGLTIHEGEKPLIIFPILRI